jgi:hypothetical protein
MAPKKLQKTNSSIHKLRTAKYLHEMLCNQTQIKILLFPEQTLEINSPSCPLRMGKII